MKTPFSLIVILLLSALFISACKSTPTPQLSPTSLPEAEKSTPTPQLSSTSCSETEKQVFQSNMAPINKELGDAAKLISSDGKSYIAKIRTIKAKVENLIFPECTLKVKELFINWMDFEIASYLDIIAHGYDPTRQVSIPGYGAANKYLFYERALRLIGTTVNVTCDLNYLKIYERTNDTWNPVGPIADNTHAKALSYDWASEGGSYYEIELDSGKKVWVSNGCVKLVASTKAP